MRDAWRLAVGTLTSVPVRAPSQVTPAVAGSAMVLAPAAGLLVALPAAAAFWVASVLGLGSLLAAVLAVAALRLADRGFHLDGLADTADGLAASYDRERALAAMRASDTGPAGVVAVALVVLVQVAAVAQLADGAGNAAGSGGGWTAGVGTAVGIAGCVVVSRAMLVLGCLRGVPAARGDGLGVTVAGSVRRLPAVIVLVLVTAALAAVLGAGTVAPWWSAVVVVAVPVAGTALVLRRCVRRFGGVTGDVLGAVVEVSLAAALVALAALW